MRLPPWWGFAAFVLALFLAAVSGVTAMCLSYYRCL
jgi:hypothetical protein